MNKLLSNFFRKDDYPDTVPVGSRAGLCLSPNLNHGQDTRANRTRQTTRSSTQPHAKPRLCVFGFEWMVVRFVRVIRLPACARVSRVSRVCPGSPGVFLPVYCEISCSHPSAKWK